MIEELKAFDRENDPYDYNEPLLEYAEKVANEFWKDYDPTKYKLADGKVIEGQVLPSLVPYDFACRYIEGKIDVSRKQKYIESLEVQESLRAFNLDFSKFWYLCLMVKDYVDSRTQKAIILNPSHREELVSLINQLDKLKHNNSNPFQYEGEGTLTVKIGNERSLTITDGNTLAVIRFAIAKLLEETSMYHELLDTIPVDKENVISLPLVYQIYMFNHYLSWFLKPINAIKGIFASKDKSLLISRMIYILGISDDRRYYQDYQESGDKLNFLKRNLSKYKNIDIKTLSNTYFL